MTEPVVTLTLTMPSGTANLLLVVYELLMDREMDEYQFSCNFSLGAIMLYDLLLQNIAARTRAVNRELEAFNDASLNIDHVLHTLKLARGEEGEEDE
jgi:hypothetical protein